MCIGIAQYKLDYGKSFRETDLARIQQFKDIEASISLLKPNNLRINLWKEAVIIPQANLEPRLAQFAWLEPKKDGGTWPVFNVRVEGGWNNKENSENYIGPYLVFTNPYVKELIQTQRCIIPCDFFIEQTSNKKIKKKFLIEQPNQKPIHLAGVYNELTNPETGEIKTFFTILTTAQNRITKKVGHKRSPVIIKDSHIKDYLSKKTNQELETFFKPMNEIELQAYEVDSIISKIKCPLLDNDLKLREPISDIISS
jgi:hypothetical protein